MSDIDRDAVTARAFALYVRRGRQPGRALEDWYEAERQIRTEVSSAHAAPARQSLVMPAPLSRPIPGPAVPARPPSVASAPPARSAGAAVPAVFAAPPSAPSAPAPGARLSPATPAPKASDAKPSPGPGKKGKKK